MYRCAIVCFLGAVLACGCGRRDKEISPLLSAIMNDSVSMAYDRPGDSVPDDGCVRLRTRTKLPLSKLFNDINPQHIESSCILMCALLRGVAVDPSEPAHCERSAKHTRNLRPVVTAVWR